MQNILIEYEMLPTTWFYVSSLMILGIFFKFYRFWSVRNLDLIALLAFTPGLLLVAYQQEEWDEWGYAWLFTIGGFFLIRLLLDAVMVRRPLLEPNLNASGLTFTGAALLVFLMANVITNKAAPLSEQALESNLSLHGSGYSSLYAFANLYDEKPDNGGEGTETSLSDNRVGADENLASKQKVPKPITRAVAILGHLMVVIGMVLIGYRHFDNIQTGVAAASLYLLLPYTSQMTGRVDHVIPAALLVWAVVTYRRPGLAGALVGLAGGLIFYPLFLLPLWCSFYWRRGVVRFAIGVIVVLLPLLVLLALASGGVAPFADGLLDQLLKMFGWTGLSLRSAGGFWEAHEETYCIPVIAMFMVLCGGLALWPAQKHLGTLLSCSAVVLLGTQFCHAHQGGLYMAWYLPLLVLTIFRPNLEDRVALTAVSESRLPWQRTGQGQPEGARA